jgi:hypothetical protein
MKKETNRSVIIVCLYVDNLIFTGNNPDMFDALKRSMAKEFEMINIGQMTHFLEIKIVQNKKGILIS